MPKETMTPKERWLAVLAREKPDRVPMDYWATGEASAKLVEHLGVADLGEALKQLHVDTPLTLGGRYVGPESPKGSDIWGVEHRTVDYGTGSYSEAVSSPLAGHLALARLVGLLAPAGGRREGAHAAREGGRVGAFP